MLVDASGRQVLPRRAGLGIVTRLPPRPGMPAPMATMHTRLSREQRKSLVALERSRWGRHHKLAAAFVREVLRERMSKLAAQQRYEEAATTRDRLSALLGAVRRTSLLRALGEIGDAEVSLDDTTWLIGDGRLVDVRSAGRLTAALPVEALDTVTIGQPVPRVHADEALCLAKFLDGHADRLTVRCSGSWTFPIHHSTEIPPLPRAA